MVTQTVSGADQDAGDVSVETTETLPDEVETTDVQVDENPENDLPEGVKRRLGRQAKQHRKEMNQMRSQMEALQNHLSSTSNQSPQQDFNADFDTEFGDEARIKSAVQSVFQQQKEEEQKAVQAQQLQRMQKKYQALDEHLGKASEKYDDFDDVVFGDGVPFTSHMRDTGLMLPKSGPGSAAEVMYKLGKNRPELERISTLDPVDQAAELVRLSTSMVSGALAPQSASSAAPMNGMKARPTSNSSSEINENTSVSEIRKRLRSGRR